MVAVAAAAAVPVVTEQALLPYLQALLPSKLVAGALLIQVQTEHHLSLALHLPLPVVVLVEKDHRGVLLREVLVVLVVVPVGALAFQVLQVTHRRLLHHKVILVGPLAEDLQAAVAEVVQVQPVALLQVQTVATVALVYNYRLKLEIPSFLLDIKGLVIQTSG